MAKIQKICRECGSAKPPGDFFPSRYTANGLTDRCRYCVFDESKRRSISQICRAAVSAGAGSTFQEMERIDV